MAQKGAPDSKVSVPFGSESRDPHSQCARTKNNKFLNAGGTKDKKKRIRKCGLLFKVLSCFFSPFLLRRQEWELLVCTLQSSRDGKPRTGRWRKGERGEKKKKKKRRGRKQKQQYNKKKSSGRKLAGEEKRWVREVGQKAS